MGLLDGMLGGLVGGEMATVVNHLIEQHGGVQGIVSQFQRQGLGETVKSWVGTGANQAISADQIQQALGADKINALAAKFGINPQDLSEKLSKVLPQAVDRQTRRPAEFCKRRPAVGDGLTFTPVEEYMP